MQQVETGPGESRLRRARIFTAVLVALVMLGDLMTYERGHAVMENYCAMLVYALIGVGLYRGDYRGDRLYQLGLFFVAWFAFTRVLNGDHYLQFSYNRYRLVSLCATYGLALPFARMLRDAKERRALDALALVLTLTFAALVGLALLSIPLNRLIKIPFFQTEFGMKESRLVILSQHPYFTAFISLAGFFMTLYLLSAHWKPLLLVPALLCMGVFTAGIVLTTSRTALVVFAFTLLVAAVILLSRLKLSRRRRRIILLVGAVVLAAAVIVGFGPLTKWINDRIPGENPNISAERNFFTSLATLTGRRDLYEAVPQVIRAYPQLLLKGFDELEMMPTVNEYATYERFTHMHNSYLQTLMLTGLPGLLAAIWYTVRMLGAMARSFKSKALPVAEKLLALVPLSLFLSGLLEHYLFVDTYSILNFVFFLFLGYLFETDRRFKTA